MKKIMQVAFLASLSIATYKVTSWSLPARASTAHGFTVVDETDTETTYSNGLIVTHSLSESTGLEPTVTPLCLLNVTSNGAQWLPAKMGGYAQFQWGLVCLGAGTNSCSATTEMIVDKYNADTDQWVKVATVTSSVSIFCSSSSQWTTGVVGICGIYGSGLYLVLAYCGDETQFVEFNCE